MNKLEAFFNSDDEEPISVNVTPEPMRLTFEFHTPKVTTKKLPKKLIDDYYIIYKTTNLVNGKIYIGRHIIHNNKLDDGYLGSGDVFIRAVKKYGVENFRREEIEFCTEETVENKEEFWIDYFDSRNPIIGYNVDKGGYWGGQQRSSEETEKEWRRKLSIANKGRKHTEETKRKQSEWMLENCPVRGTHHSEEHKAYLREINSGEKNGFYGKQHTEEKKQYWSETRKGTNVGEKNGFYGKHHSNETKRILSEKRKNKTASLETRRKQSERQKGKHTGKDNSMYGRTGELSPVYGAITVHNPITKEIKRIKKNDLIPAGFKLGKGIIESFETKNKKSLNKSIYDYHFTNDGVYWQKFETLKILCREKKLDFIKATNCFSVGKSTRVIQIENIFISKELKASKE